MNLSRLFILRPVATSLLMIALVLVGLVAVRFLPVSSLPAVDYPTIQVQTFYPGASPDVMATTVTAPLEVQLGEIPGLQQMISYSSEGASVITLQFDLSLSLDIAEQNVQQAINASNSYLPSGLPAPPTYAKVNPADQPILTLAVTSKSMSLTQLEDAANNRLATKISEVPGVGLVGLAGGNVPAVRVEADPQKLAAYGLNLDDLRTLLANVNVSQPKGNFDGPELDYTINANDQIVDPKDYLDTVIAYQNGAPVYLRDVARATQAPQDVERGAWFNHTPAIVLNVQRQPGANVIATVNQIMKQLPALESTLPAGMQVSVVSDSTGVIRSSVSDAAFELVLAVVLVVLVIFVFLRNVPATIIPSISVPVSLVGTLAVMYELNYSIDNLSLMALIIATGFVVDDSIVMIENVVRYLEEGKSPLEAALEGAGQIGFTILSLTVSLIAVLIPLLFMGGVIGRLFSEFAVTLAVTIVISAVVSLTVVPMLCARILRAQAQRHPSRFERISEGLFDKTLSAYERGLRWVLDHQTLTLLVALGTVVLTAILYIVIPKGLFPVQDIGVIQGISVADNSVSYTAMAVRQAALAEAILKDPNVTSVTSYVGIDGTNPTLNNGRFLINLRARDDRSLTAQQIVRRLQQEVADVPGIKLYLQPEQDLTLDTTVSPNQYKFVLRGPNQQTFDQYVPALIARMKQISAITDVTSDLNTLGLSVNVEVNRQLAARYGITAATIDNALYDALGQRIVSTIFEQSDQYRVILVAKPEALPDLQSLGNLYLPSQTSSTGQVPLKGIATIKVTKSPLVISHLAQFPAVTISFNLAKDASLSTAVDQIRKAEQAVNLPPSITSSFQGAAQAFEDSLQSEVYLLVAALVAVYIVLGVLYESYIHPVTILSTLPSAGIGALLALMLAGSDLDVIGIIGIVLLIGIVKKNAIMMVDFALDAERNHGKSPRDAIFEASLLRFRPILMTTLAAMLGALPMLLGTGTGSELRRPLGLAIIGGLTLSQMLTLFTTPVIYLCFDRIAQRVRQRAADRAARSEP
ncbi:Multidrug resistance protein MdtB [Paraburkholderia domus]|jgi:Cation/multidrug efflux pump|uniref:Multidrug resistance protein MdtB n=1 Tax=Paraburkholderia domus TaxID=2793075 RepID=A0A9N8MSY6_9BURK|nr:efflux RND transporter permease subunit [Paraburkholderia domus]MBK5049176.1 efflux RND transporter permease subunit [Burkholderia sp. R-70006]MBK5060145.1 efflux RND transporter permease subunit [Burkholderia sp. R-70199]MBK5085223.1 efflux RND transporter permease subunit [Burkholderia sp. R-69927]MBK5118409.1 efflux RND transporter permease subunit [Burkholderia sp. R-69980]MBK5164247.1 efflux RND transporter permease subunit [Burkholderia sp. R-70211]MBK5179716.1 efflux RND transporter